MQTRRHRDWEHGIQLEEVLTPTPPSTNCEIKNERERESEIILTHKKLEINECTKFVDMYHSETPDENKELIISALRVKNSEKELFKQHLHLVWG